MPIVIPVKPAILDSIPSQRLIACMHPTLVSKPSRKYAITYNRQIVLPSVQI
ncbi:hypothetical protein P692DRAFT_201788899 [Suillus brevipes Sb2]|nr:hypothetical protein P692DRAFT_201788899 [Suillus brevipes Sb2]